MNISTPRQLKNLNCGNICLEIVLPAGAELLLYWQLVALRLILPMKVEFEESICMSSDDPDLDAGP